MQTLADNKDHLVVSSIQILDLLSNAEQGFRQSLSIGFPTLLTVLHHIVEIPLHPVQCHTLKLVLRCISDCPEIVSGCQIEELVLILSNLFRRDAKGDIGMLAQTFTVACSTFLAVLKLPSSRGILKLAELGQELLNYAVLPSLYIPRRNSNEVFLYALYLLKETYTYSCQSNMESLNGIGLTASVIEICESHVLPWLKSVLDKVEEEVEIIMGVLETFHSILLHGYDPQAKKFAETLASSSWFTLSYGYLGLFASDEMKCRVYSMLSSIVDGVLGHEAGQPIRDAFENLPSDPVDLLFLLGQKSLHDVDLVSCQAAVVLILYTSALYDERIADEKQVLASLDQYILVNSTNFLSGMADSTTLTQVVNLYSLLRGAMKSNLTPYSPEAEKLIFHLMVEKEWTLLSTRIHPTAVKWLFQQEEIIIPMCNHVLDFCRLSSIKDAHSSWHKTDQRWTIDIHLIADLVAVGDNYAASLLVALLKQLHQDGEEEDGALVMKFMIEIINRSPVASDQFCVHGIAQTIPSFLSTKYTNGFFTTSLLLLFNILHSTNPKMLLDQDAWVLVTRKLLEHFAHTSIADTCNHDQHLLLAVLSLILYHSTNQVLTEASTAIARSASLISAVNVIIQAGCSNGPTLIDHDETTNTGESLCFILLLFVFSLRSSHVLLQSSLDWQDFLLSSTEARPVIFISCQDLCRFVHFGSSLIKLVASHCLLELLTKISEQIKSKQEELKCSVCYLQSLITVLEGMIFFRDTRVAINCALCLSEIFGWEKLDMSHQDKWCRLVVEELALSLVLPSFASKSFTNQLKPPTWIAVTLLKLNQVPKWMKSTFDGSCISSIIGNLSASNVSTEMVQLFRELVAHKYLNSEQVANLNHVFQACRKLAYMMSSQEVHTTEQFERVISVPDDMRNVLLALIRLMSGASVNLEGVQTDAKRLLEEIELFSVECPGKEL